jgi:hypothetical protein
MSGTVDLLTSDKKRIVSRPVAIAFFDPVSGQRVVLARVKDCRPELLSSNEIVYADAFAGNGIQAAVVYKYDVGRFSQDVKFLNLPVSPGDFGLGSRTRLEILTAIEQCPTPTITSHILAVETDATLRGTMAQPDLVDQMLDFGGMHMPLGHAYPSKAPGVPLGPPQGVVVAKQLVSIDGQTVLVEAIPWDKVTNQLNKLPQQSAKANQSIHPTALTLELAKNQPNPKAAMSFESRLAEITRSRPILLASAVLDSQRSALNANGFVMDYTIVPSSGPYTFEAGETYLVNGMVYLSGVTFHQGAIIKYGHPFATLTIEGSVSTYYPPTGPSVVFTSMNDDSVGDPIDDSNGDPGGSAIAGWELQLEDLDVNPYFGPLDFRYAYGGINVDASAGYSVTIESASFMDIYEGMQAGEIDSLAVGSAYVCSPDYPIPWGTELYEESVPGTVSIDSISTCDSDDDSLPDWWELRYYGNLSHTGSDLDSGGVHTLLYDYQHGLDPNVIQFSIGFANNYVTTSTPTLQLNIAGGVPAYYAVLVDNNNFAGANWLGYSGPSLSLNLGSTQGPHNVWIGLHGLPANAQQTWHETTVVLDSTSPTISITSPPNNSSFNTVRVNVAGTFTESCLKQITVNGVPAYINGNAFEAMNVPLAVGANTITATLQNLAGSTATASIAATGGANPVDPVQLQATPIAGFAPLNVTFQPSANVPGTIQQVLYDFNGDGISDQTATDLNPISHSYSSAGQFFPAVTIVTTAGRFSSSGGWNSADPNRLRINVQSPPVQQNVISVADPVDVKCDCSGYLYVLSRSTAAITEYNAGGSSIRSLTGIGTAPRGLDVDSAGNVFVAMTGDNQVWKFNPTPTSFQIDGSFGNSGYIGIDTGSAGDGPGEFNAPFDVAVSPDGGTISVSDSGNDRIQQFDPSGNYLDTFGSQGSAVGQFDTPKGLTYDSAGYLYIVDSGNNRIAVALSSSVIGTSGTSGTALGQFQEAINLGVGSRGIYVADTGNNRVQIFDPMATGDGAASTTFGVRGSISTELSLNQPLAVAAATDLLQEKIYIADTGNNRIILCNMPDGNLSALQAAWQSMKTHVASGDINGALSYFSAESVDQYRQAFLAVGTANAISAINQIGTLIACSIDGDSAELYFTTTIDGQSITFPVDFVNENGAWRISEF